MFKSLKAVVLLLLSASAFAGNVPAEVSGTYQGSGTLQGWECEIRAFQTTQQGGTNRVLSADCQTPDGSRAGSVSTNEPCISDFFQPPLPRRGDACGPPPFYCVPPGTPKLAILAYTPSTQFCALGEITAEITSSTQYPAYPGTPGVSARMCRTQIVATNPYPGCASPTMVVMQALRRARGLFCSIKGC